MRVRRGVWRFVGVWWIGLIFGVAALGGSGLVCFAQVDPQGLRENTGDRAVALYAKDVENAARALIQLTPENQREQLVLPFASAKRTTGRQTGQTPAFCAVLAWCPQGWGVSQCQMSQEQLVALHKLLSLALSPGGYQTLLAVLNRQRVIGEMEEAADKDAVAKAAADHPDAAAESIFDFAKEVQPKDDPARWYPAVGGAVPPTEDPAVKWVWDPPGLKVRHQQFCEYSVAIFGDPGADQWGLRFEGHHISVNLTFLKEDGRLTVHGSPLFFGAFPMIVPADPFPAHFLGQEWSWTKGQVMMFSMAHHIRRFWLALPARCREKAFIARGKFEPQAAPLLLETPPPWLVSSLAEKVDRDAIKRYGPLEVGAAALNAEAAWHLQQAFYYYAGAMQQDVGADYIRRLEKALSAAGSARADDSGECAASGQGGEALVLAWAGGPLDDAGSHLYSYLSVGSLLLEFLQSNQFSVQHDPSIRGNHVHGMVRDLDFDWTDPMRDHHAKDHLRRKNPK